MMELLFVWILFGFICWIVANTKGRNGLGWFMIGVLLGPIGLISFRV